MAAIITTVETRRLPEVGPTIMVIVIAARFEVIVRLKMICVVLLLVFLHPWPSAGLGQLPRSEKQQPEDEQTLKVERDLAKKRNQTRQASLARDTEKLLKLATELKEYVDKSNENTMSLEVIRKAEEIEKLARRVREKMKGY